MTKGKRVSELLSDIKENYEDDVLETTHVCSFETSHAERFAKATELLKIYASARLVLTSRIHCALPCLALGTPVVLIAPYDGLRYKGLGELLNHVYLLNGRVQECAILQNKDGNIVNSQAFKPYAEKLKTVCKRFIQA